MLQFVTQSQSSLPFSAFRWMLETVCWYYIVILGNCIAYGSVNSLKTIINGSEYSYWHNDRGVFSGSALWTCVSSHVACVVPQLWLTPNITSGSHVMQKCTEEELPKNGALNRWCYFVSTKLVSTPQGTLPPSSSLAASLLGPQAWGCGQTEESLPSWLESALAMQQLCRGKPLADFCGAGLQKRLQKTVKGNLPNFLFVL